MEKSAESHQPATTTFRATDLLSGPSATMTRSPGVSPPASPTTRIDGPTRDGPSRGGARNRIQQPGGHSASSSPAGRQVGPGQPGQPSASRPRWVDDDPRSVVGACRRLEADPSDYTAWCALVAAMQRCTEEAVTLFGEPMSIATVRQLREQARPEPGVAARDTAPMMTVGLGGGEGNGAIGGGLASPTTNDGAHTSMSDSRGHRSTSFSSAQGLGHGHSSRAASVADISDGMPSAAASMRTSSLPPLSPALSFSPARSGATSPESGSPQYQGRDDASAVFPPSVPALDSTTTATSHSAQSGRHSNSGSVNPQSHGADYNSPGTAQQCSGAQVRVDQATGAIHRVGQTHAPAFGMVAPEPSSDMMMARAPTQGPHAVLATAAPTPEPSFSAADRTATATYTSTTPPRRPEIHSSDVPVHDGTGTATATAHATRNQNSALMNPGASRGGGLRAETSSGSMQREDSSVPPFARMESEFPVSRTTSEFVSTPSGSFLPQPVSNTGAPNAATATATATATADAETRSRDDSSARRSNSPSLSASTVPFRVSTSADRRVGISAVVSPATGQMCAVRVMPSAAVAQREFDILKRIEHKNVLRAVEVCGPRISVEWTLGGLDCVFPQIAPPPPQLPQSSIPTVPRGAAHGSGSGSNRPSPHLRASQPPLAHISNTNMGGSGSGEVGGTGLPEALAVPYLRDAAEALAHAHSRGIVHRNVKPRHLLFGTDGRVVLGGFRCAIKVPDGSGGDMSGTARFMSPETLSGEPSTPGRDVWAWACTAVQVLTGKEPYHGKTTCASVTEMMKLVALDGVVPEIPPAVSPELQAVLRQCFAMDPRERPTAAEILTRSCFV